MLPNQGMSSTPAGATALGPLLAWAGFAILLGLAPLLASGTLALSLISQMGIAIIVCLSYNLLLGQGGMLSFGHAVYSGVGAFLSIHSLALVAHGWPLPVSLVPVLGGLAGLALALVLGWVTTRHGATPFAMITLGMGELVWAAALMFPGLSGGEGGVSGDRSVGAGPWGLTLGPPLQLYYLIAAYTLACTGLLYAFTRTPLGRLLNAVRDNPERVGFIGHDPHIVRYLAFAIAAFFAGVSGGLAALHFEVVTSDVLSGQRSGAYLLFTVLGGTGFFVGPIIGAILMVLAFAVFSEWTRAWLLYLGLAFMLMVMLAPGGLASLLLPQRWHALARRVRLRPWRHLALVSGWALVLGAAAAVVEMAYQFQERAALGDVVWFLGLALHSGAPRDWLAAALVGACGAMVIAGASRRARARQPDAGVPP